MNRSFLALSISVFVFFYGCKNTPAPSPTPIADSVTNDTAKNHSIPKKVKLEAIQKLLDSTQLVGSVLLFDPQEKTYYSNNFDRCDQGYLPASTYKITNSIIALETGVMESDTTLIKWNGEQRRMKVWEQDLLFKQAFHASCVPCYQEIARKIGPERMNKHLKAFNYGNMVVDSSNIDVFWLEGPSRITQNQQMDFIKRFYTEKLPIKDRTYEIMKRMIIIDEDEDQRFSGKTGWSIRDGFNVGWFVGYLEKGDNVYYVVTNVEPTPEFNIDEFGRVRQWVSTESLKMLLDGKL